MARPRDTEGSIDDSRWTAIFNPRTWPLFSVFFFWSFGTGALWLVRPLVAFDFSQHLAQAVFLVTVISAANTAPKIIASPLAGWLSDRWGRRWLVIGGAALHGLALVGDYFATDYLQYFLLELVNGFGIAVTMTTMTVLMADHTEVGHRGRAVAVRQMSSRIGSLSGPIVGGLIASMVGLREVFLFIAATKAAVIVVTLLFVHERARRERAAAKAPAAPAAGPAPRRRRFPDLSMFATRSFLALCGGTFAMGMLFRGPGVFRTLFPVQAQQVAGLSEAQIGNLISVAGVCTLLVALPMGMSIDRYGRKPLLAGALAVAALSAYLLGGVVGLATAVAAVVAFGLAEGAVTGGAQVYAMDLAQTERRGTFLGGWTFVNDVGQLVGPLTIGLIADVWGFGMAGTVLAGVVLLSAALLLALGKETGRGAVAIKATGGTPPNC